jgi:3-hydroxyacyl-[acyl-carrier-protein] dehydratase
VSDGTSGSPPSLSAGARLAVEVPAAGSWYEGHFPGRPILPGIGLLHLALGALGAAGAPAGLREIVQLRFRRLLSPGEAVELEVKGIDPGGRCRFEASRAGEIVANGIVALGEGGPGPSLVALDRQGARAATPADLDDLLPHRPPMRFVEEVEAELTDGMVCAVRVPAGSPFAAGGSVPALVALEMAAQTAATFESHGRLRADRRRGARVGYLVGAREVRFARARVPDCERFSASVRLSWAAPPLSTYAFDVSRRGEVVAAGLLSAWLTPADA